jgi:hypothetical protein
MPLYAQDGKKKINFSRKYFELGIDAGIGFDNGLIRSNDVFRKNIILDLDILGGRIGENGLNINADLHAGFFINFRMQEKWGLGFYEGIEGNIYGNLPQSFFTLISEGNINSHNLSGNINASGGIYAATALSGFMRFGKWRFGVSPAMYTPLLYIPRNSEITYYLNTEEGIKLNAEGEIKAYTIDIDSFGPADYFKSGGFDLSVDAEYALLPSLNLGAGLSHIPLMAGVSRHLERYTLKEFYVDIALNKGLDLPRLNYESVSEACEKKIYRPLRFDAYALYRPLSFNRDLLIVRPNIGFTDDLNDKTVFFNAGIEVQSHLLRNMLFVALATGYTENIWRHRLNFAVNFRAFELDLGAALRAQNFKHSLQMSGVEVNVGLRFGW